jgi:hypothetical protein
MHTMHLLPSAAMQPNLELKTQPKQLLGSLPLVIALPALLFWRHPFDKDFDMATPYIPIQPELSMSVKKPIDFFTLINDITPWKAATVSQYCNLFFDSVLLSCCHIHAINNFLKYRTLLSPELELLTLP